MKMNNFLSLRKLSYLKICIILFVTIVEQSCYVVTLRNQDDSDSSSGPIVRIPNGIIKGKSIRTSSGKEVYAFLGIPFAKPPIGSLKFQAPVSLSGEVWDEPWDATKLPNACTQLRGESFPGFPGEEQWNPNTPISDDCLYLNVWVSADVIGRKRNENESSISAPVPVLFWIYGGGYYSGSSALELYDGATLAGEKDIVIVSSQYRVGPQGFLYFGIPDAPGNVGLLDQNLALQWINSNIMEFGGNPGEITLFGESCGAASVSFHLLSSLSNTLFKRAILLSGAATADWAFKTPEESLELSYAIASEVGCVDEDKKSKENIIECLRTIQSELLHQAAWKNTKGVLDLPLVPTLDNYFLTQEPESLVTKWDIPRKDIIIGTVQDEGTYFQLYSYLKYFNNLNPTLIPYEGFVWIMKDIFKGYSEIEQDAILFYYTNWNNLNDGYMNQKLIGQALGDAFLTCPVRQFADKWSGRGGGLNVYYYQFTEHTDSDLWGEWMGVKHGDEILYFFGQPLNISNIKFTENERSLSQNVVDLVYNFMTKGEPSPNWSPYTSSNPIYLNLNGSIVTDQTQPNLYGPRALHCAFWNEYLPRLRAQTQSSSGRHYYASAPRNENSCSAH